MKSNSLRIEKKKSVILLLLFIITFAVMTNSLLSFSKDIEENQTILATQRLKDIANQNSGYIKNIMHDYTEYIDALAMMLETYDDLHSPEVKVFLEKMANGTQFKEVAIDFSDGYSYTSEGQTVKIKHGVNYMDNLQKGNSLITDLTFHDDGHYISVLSPIIKNGKVIAAARGTIYPQKLGELLNIKFFDGNSYSLLINSKGTLLFSPQQSNIFMYGSNYFDSLKKITKDNGFTSGKIMSDIANGFSDYKLSNYDGREYYNYYMPVGINDWYIVIIASKTTVDENSGFIQTLAIHLLGEIAFVLIAAFLCVLYIMKRSRDELNKVNKQFEIMTATIPGGIVVTDTDDDFTLKYVSPGYYELVGYNKEEFEAKFKNICIATLHPDERNQSVSSAQKQLEVNGSFSVTARLSHKTKGYIWVHLRGKLCNLDNGESKIYIVIVDITEHINLMEQLQKEQEFSNLITNLTDDGFFDCDISNKTIRYSKNFAERLGLPEVLYNYPQVVLDRGLVAPDSIHLYENRFMNTTDGVIDEEIHLLLPSGEEVWYLYRYNIIRDINDKPIRAVGRVTDITKQNIKMRELAEKAQKDQLTGLYNKVTAEYLITETLAKKRYTDSKYALMIIDVDNFKMVNDLHGHLYGDIVLSRLADILKNLFRSNDIIGRMGGDEFFVLLKNFSSLDIVKAKAANICELFKHTYTEKNVSCSISASIGIAIYPEDGSDFKTLYKKADMALYKSKEKGKNTFTIYHEK